MEIWFVRHAEKEKDSKEPKLTERGIQQAKLLAKSISEIPFDEMYCSDTLRTKETARYITKLTNNAPNIEPSLNEYSLRTLKLPVKEWKEGEPERYKKLAQFLENITQEKNVDKKILIIAHGVTNKILLAHLLEIDKKSVIRFAQQDTAINKAYWSETFSNWRLKTWNDIHHLPEELQKNSDGY